MNKNDLFKELDGMDIENIAKDFPVLTDDEKERIYAMSERKYNISDNTNEEFSRETEVSGVEVYKRPKWRTASIAASLALLIGAGSFGGYNIAKQLKNSSNGDDDTVPTSMVSSEMTQPSTEDPRAEEYRGIAKSLADEFDNFLDPLDEDKMPKYPDVNLSQEQASNMTDEELMAYYDKYEEEYKRIDEECGQSIDSIWFELGRGNSYDHVNYTSLGAWYYYHYNVGMKYSNTDEVMEKALSFMTQDCIDKQFPHLIGEDLSGYEINRIYDADNENYPDLGVFAMYNGDLYYDSDAYERYSRLYYFYDRKDEPIEITDITDDSFTAVIKYDFTSVPNKYDMSMKVINNGGSWVISDVEPIGPELDPQKLALVDKIINSPDYFDKMSAKNADIEKYDYKTDEEADLRKTINNTVFFCDNRAPKEYSYSDNNYSDYSGEFDCASLLEYAKGINAEDIEKHNETYCDGEKNYYWTNPTDAPYDYSYYHYNTYSVPHEDDAEKYDGFDKFRLDKYRSPNWYACKFRPSFIYGSSLVRTYMYEFNKWDITGETSLSGRDCLIVEGKIDFLNDEMCIYPEDYYGSFKFFIDKETGIPIGTEFYAKDGETIHCSLYYDIRLNDEAEPVPDVDISGYNFTYK